MSLRSPGTYREGLAATPSRRRRRNSVLTGGSRCGASRVSSGRRRHRRAACRRYRPAWLRKDLLPVRNRRRRCRDEPGGRQRTKTRRIHRSLAADLLVVGLLRSIDEHYDPQTKVLLLSLPESLKVLEDERERMGHSLPRRLRDDFFAAFTGRY